MYHKKLALLMLITVIGWIILPVKALQATTLDLSIAMQATVQLIVMDGDEQPIASGSGSLITPDGLVLTNYHVVADNPLDDRVLVRVPKNLKRGSYTEYWGQVIERDPEGDLAVVAIYADNKGKTLKGTAEFPVIPLGDSDGLTVGEEIYALGYPDISFGQLLVTKGMVSGFYEESGIKWIASDVEISHGNSGGLVVNGAGELVAVPTAVHSSFDTAAALAYLRPINDATTLLQAARQLRAQTKQDGRADLSKTIGDEAGVLFAEDFTSNKAGWNLVSIDDRYATVEYRIAQGHLHTIAEFKQARRAGLSVPDLKVADFRLSVDVEFEKARGEYGMVTIDFRQNAKGDFYSLGLSNLGTYAVNLFSDNKWHPLQPWTASSAIDLTPGGNNHIELLVVGNLFTLFVNQEELVTVEDIDNVLPAAGALAFGFEGPAQAEFTVNLDNLTISTPQAQHGTSDASEADARAGAMDAPADTQWIRNQEGTVSFLAPADWTQLPLAQPDPNSTLLVVSAPDESAAMFVALMNDEVSQLFDLEGLLRLMDQQMAMNAPFTCRTKKSFDYADDRFDGIYRVQSNCNNGRAQMVTLAVKSTDGTNMLVALGGFFADKNWMPTVEQVLSSLTVNNDGNAHRPTQFDAAQEPSALVIATELDVHQGPRTSYRVIETVQIGDVLRVLAQYKACAWLQVETPSGEQGWVLGDLKSVVLATSCEQIPEAER